MSETIGSSPSACVQVSAAVIISLLDSAEMNDLDPCAYLRVVLERLPICPASCNAELLRHCLQPANAN